MPKDPLERLFDESQDAELDALLGLLGREIQAMEEVIPGAVARQWQASPVPKPRDDTSQRAQGERSDSTADTALDTRRMKVRASVTDAAWSLRLAITRVRSARTGLEAAVARYDGTGE